VQIRSRAADRDALSQSMRVVDVTVSASHPKTVLRHRWCIDPERMCSLQPDLSIYGVHFAQIGPEARVSNTASVFCRLL
jgi:hypothetical protein